MALEIPVEVVDYTLDVEVTTEGEGHLEPEATEAPSEGESLTEDVEATTEGHVEPEVTETSSEGKSSKGVVAILTDGAPQPRKDADFRRPRPKKKNGNGVHS